MRIRLKALRLLIREALEERALMWEDAIAGEQEPNELYADYRPTDNYRPANNYRPEDNYRPDAEAYIGISTPIGPEDNYRPTDASAYIGFTVPQSDEEITDEDEYENALGNEDHEDEMVTTANITSDAAQDNEEPHEEEEESDELNKQQFRVD